MLLSERGRRQHRPSGPFSRPWILLQGEGPSAQELSATTFSSPVLTLNLTKADPSRGKEL